MGYCNLSSTTKQSRAQAIIGAIGSAGLMNFYTGSYPASPDIPTTGILLASLPLSSPCGVASLAVQSGVVTSPGTGGTNGVYTLTITGGGGTGAQGTFTVAGGLLSIITITNNGSGYTSVPTLSGFATAGLSGATATGVMTGVIVFNTISTASGLVTGTAGFVRIVTSGSVPIMDLDVGTTNASSVIMNNTFINQGGSVSCTAQILIEA